MSSSSPEMPARPPVPSLAEWELHGAFFNYQGHQIFYRTTLAESPADAPTLLLIHGFPTASWDWVRLWEPLARHFRLVTLDLIGFGFSDKPWEFPFSIMAQATLIEALLHKLAVTRVHLLAHDYGDTVAQELLARHLDGSLKVALESICFLNGGLFPESHRPVLVQRLLLSPLGPLVARLSSQRVFARNLSKVFGPATQPSPEELAGFWRLASRQNGMAVMRKHIRYMVERRQHRARWVGALERSSIPLRLIDGAVDPVSGAHLAARYRELVPKADVVLLDGIGHYPQVEAPAAVLDAFLAFHGKTPS